MSADLPISERAAELVACGMAPALYARLQPDMPAIISEDGDRSFAELNANANRLVRLLRSSGLQSGDSVALLAANTPAFVEVLSACMRSGLRLTPINWHQSPEIVSYVVGNCDAKALIASARFADMALEAASTCPGLVTKLACEGAIAGFDRYEEAIAAEDAEDIEDPELGSTMLYTSGTTGRPKGVFRGVRQAVRGLDLKLRESAGFDRQRDRCLVTGPLYHAAPLSLNLLLPLNAGIGCVLMDKWDAGEALRLIEQHRVTHTHVVPTMLQRMVGLPTEERARHDISSLRWVLHGAAPCPRHVKQAAMDWLGPIIYEYYAATEGGGVLIGPEDWLRKPGSVGKPIPGVVMTILDENGNESAVGEVGTVYFKAPESGRFHYHGDAAKTDGSYRGDYYTMGDHGYIDEDGFLFLTGRTAELIISGGVNIYPAQIDETLLRHPAIMDVGAVGIPSDEWGEEVKAVVQLKPDATPSPALEKDIIAFARDQLGSVFSPKSVDFVDELPRLPSGKLLRRELRERYWSERKDKI